MQIKEEDFAKYVDTTNESYWSSFPNGLPFSSIIFSSYKTRSISWFLSASFLSNSLSFISSWSNKTYCWRSLIIWWSWFRFSSSSRLRVSFLKRFSLFRSKLLFPLHAIFETLARKDLLDTILEFVKISAICWGTWIDKQFFLMSLFCLCSSFLSIKSENLSQCKEFPIMMLLKNIQRLVSQSLWIVFALKFLGK